MRLIEAWTFGVAFAGYAVGLFFYVGYALSRREMWGRWGRRVLIFAVGCQIVSLVTRVMAARTVFGQNWYVPWSNWFESFSFFAFLIVVGFLLIETSSSLPILGVFVVPFAGWAGLMSFIEPLLSGQASIVRAADLGLLLSSARAIPQLPPALQSYWMAVHVPAMFVAYAAFTNAFGLGLAYLIQERQIKSRRPAEFIYRLPSLEELDRLIYKVIFLAFPVLTLGIILGARWAYEAWGRYWGWDPKETWALITWLIYLAYLHVRLAGGWRGRRTAYFALFGFAVVLFTYVGVNYLSVLHGFLSGVGR